MFTHIGVFALGATIAFISSKDGNVLSGSTEGGREEGRASQTYENRRLGEPGLRTARPSSKNSERPGSVTSTTGTRETIGKLNRMGDAYERQRALMNFFDSLGPDQFSAVADEFRTLNHYSNSRSEMELLFRAWAKADPTAALQYVEDNPDMARNRGEILETWAGGDPAAAEQWARDKHDGEGANPFMHSVIRGIAAYDIPNASRLTQEMPLGRERGRAIDAVAKALLMEGTEAAFAFPDSIEDDHLKGSFVLMISQNLSRQDPQAAADWVAGMDNGAVQERASGGIASYLAREDVDKAASFVESLRPEAKANAAVATVPSMSQEDIAGTARWVSSLAGTPGYDKVVESFVWSCDERAPEQSAAWIRGVSNPEQQTRLYHRMLGGWAKKDSAAVKNWIAENNVPDSVRRKFSR